MDWQQIETAPKDGTWIQAVIEGHGSDNVIAWQNGFMDEREDSCGGWCFVTEQEPPDSWDDGVCWGMNSDGEASAPPTYWKPIPEAN